MQLAGGTCRAPETLIRTASARIAAREVANRPGRIEPGEVKACPKPCKLEAEPRNRRSAGHHGHKLILSRSLHAEMPFHSGDFSSRGRAFTITPDRRGEPPLDEKRESGIISRVVPNGFGRRCRGTV